MRRWLFVCAVLLVGALPAQRWFNAPLLLGPDNGLLRAAIDLDQDQRPEVIRFGVWVDGVPVFRILRNDGHGVLTEGPMIPLPMWMSQLLAAGDLTGDGIPDVLLATGTFTPLPPSLLLFRGDGVGGLLPPVATSLAAPARSIALADVDGDGELEVALRLQDTSTNANALGWWQGQSDGTLQPMGPALALPVAGFPIPWNIAAIDVDADGRHDLVGSDEVGATLAIYATAPDFSLQPRPALVIGLGAGFARPAVGDVNGDGIQDLALVAPNNSFQHVGIQLGRPGGGLTSLPAFVTNPLSEAWPLLFDVDDDGADDLYLQGRSATLGGFSASMSFRSDATGQQVLRYSIRGGFGTAALQPGTVADLDGDGLLDIIGGGEVHFQVPGYPGYVDDVGLGAVQSEPLYADVDDDGDIDQFVNARTFGGGPPPALYLNDGTGALRVTGLSWPVLPPNVTSFFVVPVPDLDGNGRTDLIASRLSPSAMGPFGVPAFHSLHRYELVGNGQVADRGPIAALTADPLIAMAVDVDGDADLDLIGNGLLRGDGLGGFGPLESPWTGWRPVDRGDLDGDGDIDFLALRLDSTSPHVAVIRNLGGTFAVEPIATVSAAPALAITTAASAILADLDQDGDLDAVIDLRNDNDLAILSNDAGQLSLAASWNIAAPNGAIFANAYAAVDFDGDGRTDIVANDAGQLYAYRSIGPGFTYEAPRRFQARVLRGRTDIDGDGDLDLIGDGVFVQNLARVRPTAGSAQQFGVGRAGAGGFVPLLGASGPFRPGLLGTLRVRNGLGGAPMLLAIAPARASLLNSPLMGITSYGDPWLGFLPFTLGGPVGVPGAGRFDLALVTPASFAGQTAVFQVAIADPAAVTSSGIAFTGGLAITYGL